MNNPIIDNKIVDINSIEVDNINTRDYPDFTDAYATFGVFEDGTEMNESQLDEFTNEGYVTELIWYKTMWI